MSCVTIEYFKLNRFLLLAVGLWPYQQSIFVRFQMTLFSSILISFIIFQLTTFLTAECTLDFIIKVLSTFSFFLINVIKYNSFWINTHHVKSLLEKLRQTCEQLRDENEIAIIKSYAKDAKYYTIKIMLLITLNVIYLIVQSTCPQILDTLLFTNASRNTMPIATEYFVDREKYHYLILLHTNVAIFVGAITIVGTGTTLTGLLKHSCGMFKVACYRIQRAMIIDISQNASAKSKIYDDIVYAVDIHRQAMTFSKRVLTTFEKTFFFLVIINVTCLSLNLFQVFKLMLFKGDTTEVMLHSSQTMTVLMNMFLASYIVQEVTDHNNDIFTTVYNIRWYVTPLYIQKMILFLLQRDAKAFTLNVGAIFTVSLETFSKLFSTSVSYFTILYSMWQ